ncbi:MAG: GMC oxidoreductase [Pyrinomonadaceae bacterium]
MSEKVEEFDAVVVGSGFGGSVISYRLADAGFNVCLLERGKAYPPNSFPRTPHDLGKNFWDPSEGLYGMFNVWSFKGSGGLVSAGLGGGSLIYANILARKDEKWFKYDLPDGTTRDWPLSYADLDSHYTIVERMMNAQRYPIAYEPYSDTPKTNAMQEAAFVLNGSGTPCEWVPLNLAVSFRRDAVDPPAQNSPDNPAIVGSNLSDTREHYHEHVLNRKMPRSTCRLCGECNIGCNYGSKNTLDYTYITEAWRKGAEIRPLSEVKWIARTDDGYELEYVVHDPDCEPGTENPRRRIRCKTLVLAAGTFGTPYLLMKKESKIPGLSNELGKRYSVNGDLLSFISKSIEEKNGTDVPRRLDPSFGPVITCGIRFPDDLDENGKHGRGFYVEDGGHPAMMSWLAEVSGLPGFLARSVKFLKLAAKYRIGVANDADIGGEVADLIGDAQTTLSTFPILTMGRDIASGKLFLNEDRLDCDWKIADSKEYFDRVRNAGKAIAEVLRAEYQDNPSYKLNFQQVLTAHPLGGCAMGTDIHEAVVDKNCEVFGNPGLFVVDGSVMPSAVGPNPSLTIAAIADHAADHIVNTRKPGP